MLPKGTKHHSGTFIVPKVLTRYSLSGPSVCMNLLAFMSQLLLVCLCSYSSLPTEIGIDSIWLASYRIVCCLIVIFTVGPYCHSSHTYYGYHHHGIRHGCGHGHDHDDSDDADDDFDDDDNVDFDHDDIDENNDNENDDGDDDGDHYIDNDHDNDHDHGNDNDDGHDDDDHDNGNDNDDDDGDDDGDDDHDNGNDNDDDGDDDDNGDDDDDDDDDLRLLRYVSNHSWSFSQATHRNQVKTQLHDPIYAWSPWFPTRLLQASEGRNCQVP